MTMRGGDFNGKKMHGENASSIIIAILSARDLNCSVVVRS